jgi:hypothetical protein
LSIAAYARVVIRVLAPLDDEIGRLLDAVDLDHRTEQMFEQPALAEA